MRTYIAIGVGFGSCFDHLTPFDSDGQVKALVFTHILHWSFGLRILSGVRFENFIKLIIVESTCTNEFLLNARNC